MPANYTLHRFGNEALRQLPAPQQRLIQRFRRLYNAGLHGQDLLFYYRPMLGGPAADLYSRYNGLSGREFFAQACDHLKESPSEGGTACLYGLLGHYCLMSQLATLMAQETANAGLNRIQLEVELDRYLLSLDGKNPAHRQDFSPNLKLTRGECVTVSGFFAPVTPNEFHKAYRSTLFWMKRMAAKKRGLTAFLLTMTRSGFRNQWMDDHANHKCIHLDGPMMDCYERALEAYPVMARQLTEYREKGIPLGEEFDPTFV